MTKTHRKTAQKAARPSPADRRCLDHAAALLPKLRGLRRRLARDLVSKTLAFSLKCQQQDERNARRRAARASRKRQTGGGR